jgi:diaminopimelate epimerase
MKVPFYKCNSKGNSFIIIFLSTKLLSLKPNEIINICNSVDNKKVEGLILLEQSSEYITMNYYNNDGSWETFCLNGTICCSLILKEKKLYFHNIETGSGLYGIKVMENNLVQVELPRPMNMEFDKSKDCWQEGFDKFNSILIEGFKCYYINSGAKHIVIKSNDDILFKDDLKLEKILKKIRYNKLFLPDGVNVNIYRYKAVDTIQVKTYEKGVEAMMTSCSSGSYACAYHYYHCYEKSDRIKILNDGGTSEVIFKDNKNLFLSKGEIEYKGELDI